MIPPHDRQNFDELSRAFGAGDVALMEVRRVADQTVVAVICAVSFIDGEYEFTPFAVMVEGNPFDLFDPPRLSGGFHHEVDAG
ncbi:MAG TPA: DUF6117 family protein [Fimbriimonadaceae bacterium]|mgnify:CR=1 FL=1|nr:DUF6117 family protein [Fimbriimonadaceae bacterium]